MTDKTRLSGFPKDVNPLKQIAPKPLPANTLAIVTPEKMSDKPPRFHLWLYSDTRGAKQGKPPLPTNQIYSV